MSDGESRALCITPREIFQPKVAQIVNLRLGHIWNIGKLTICATSLTPSTLSGKKSHMNQIRYRRSLFVIVTLFLLVLSAPAQIGNLGSLEAWTMKPFSRDHSANRDVTYIKTVRAARHNDFDRVVFEFTGQIPNYRIEYLKSHFYEGEAGRVRIKSAGQAFVQLEFFVIPVSDEQLKFSEAKDFTPKGRLRLGTVQSVKDQAFFEGYYDFMIGVGLRKPFRISEMSNPSRVVIDFKH
jgi:hypothetical protein